MCLNDKLAIDAILLIVYFYFEKRKQGKRKQTVFPVIQPEHCFDLSSDIIIAEF